MEHKKIVIRTIIISIVLWILIYFVGSYYRLFVVYCKSGGRCYGQFGNYLMYSILLIPFLFLIVLGINYLIEFLRNKA